MHGQKFAFALLVTSVFLASSSASAADGQIVITHAKVLAGDVTANDDPGYPATLSSPGSYILGSNLAPGSGLDAIVAAAPDITIDLNGFRISGGPAGGANNARIAINAQNDRLTVKNGTIGAFKLYGIYAYNRSYLTVENMVVVNGNQGIYNKGNFARIQNSTIATNTGRGIFCDLSCHVEGNVVSGNGVGVVINSGSVLGNTILSNAGFGIVAPIVGAPRVGFGNNTLIDNNAGGAQISGDAYRLHPNVCAPVAC
jgi:hypothetical protein